MVTDKIPHPEILPVGSDSIYQILNPYGGEIYLAGSQISVYWVGGAIGRQSVNIQLIDIQRWQVWHTVTLAYEYDTVFGAYHWNTPEDLDIDPSHDYQIYIENVERTKWQYGGKFKFFRPKL